jgi:transposase, IS30 family
MAGCRLSLEERRVIERGLEAGLDQRTVAAVLGRSPSTVCRELARARVNPDGGFRRGTPPRRCPHRWRLYRAARAQRESVERLRRPKACRLADPRLAAVVTGLLEADWSPQQIAGMLPVMFGDDEAMRISHETIYQSLFVQGRGLLRKELAAHLRTGRTARKPRGQVERRGRLVGMTPISARPAEAADRAVPGNWEGDLLCGGTGKGAVITLVERRSRFLLMAPLPHPNSVDAREALTMLIGRLPTQLRRSLTWDQGREMAQHAQFSVDTGVAVYFCDPHSPWQRGTNENTNGLLRQYLPKGCDMRNLTQDDCDAIAQRLNTRPRQTLGWKTPAQALNEGLIATAT